jgi:zinc carboxypeptidase
MKQVFAGLLALLVFALFVCSCAKEPSAPKKRDSSTDSKQLSPIPSPILQPEEWLTVAEKSNFRATSDYAQTLEYLKRLGARMPEMMITTFGKSGQGRDLPLVILSKDYAFSPARAQTTGKPVLLIQNGIHAGEIDGKDACLMILRDILFGKRRWILNVAILLIVPIYNVDGHEKISPLNRPNQDGPLDGMGFRTTTRGLDLNRDHIKLVSREAQALIGLYNEWHPHLHVDNHVTDGSDHDWVLTLAYGEEPVIAPSIHAWLQEHMTAIKDRLTRQGIRNGPYVWLNDRNDPSKGFNTSMATPRFSTTYFGLRQRSSILVELHAYKPYRARVLANRDFLVELFREIGKSPEALISSVEQAEQRMVDLGQPDAEASDIVLTYKDAPETEMISFPIYQSKIEKSLVSGKPLIRYSRGVLDEKKVPWGRKAQPDKVVARPRGYFVYRGWNKIEELIHFHGLEVAQLIEPLEIELETIRVSNPKHEKKSNQGEVRMTADVVRALETRLLPKGTLWIPADQPSFGVAFNLFEPEAPDSLLQWGMLRSVFERKTYISPQVLEEKVKRLLENNPQLEQEWKDALMDKQFAADDDTRYMWWYSRTEHWDEQVGLIPAMRLMTKPEFDTQPWSLKKN